jgi:protein-S-isoprenylcysteine O-methyltransferase Ste14
VVFFAIVYILAAKGEEKKFEASPLAEQYRAYKGKTGFFTPKLGRD